MMTTDGGLHVWGLAAYIPPVYSCSMGRIQGTKSEPQTTWNPPKDVKCLVFEKQHYTLAA